MTFPPPSRSDQDIRTDIAALLSSVPQVNVSVRRGAVTLYGDVRSPYDRTAAKQAAMRVPGVTAVADQMVVRAPGSPGHSDAELAEAATRQLDGAAGVPAGSVQVTVRDHVITLSGAVASGAQRDAASRAVMCIVGITGVTNTIALRR